MLALYGAMMDAPRHREDTELYLWACSHAVARHSQQPRIEFWEGLQQMGPAITDADVLQPGGRLYNDYRQLAHHIRRRIIARAPKLAPKRTWAPPIEVPASLAARMVTPIQPGNRVLVPSTAATELLVQAARERDAVVEDSCSWRDFLALPPDPTFDSVLVGPPYPGDSGIEHVRHAYQFLRPGGHLAAVYGAGKTTDTAKAVRLEFIRWCGEIGAKSQLLLPASMGGQKGLRLLSARRGSNA